MSTQVEAVVVGGGQSGVAMSEHLSKSGVSHVVLEKARIAEAWRTARWDSLCANGPAWHDRFPGATIDDYEQDDFVPKDRVAQYMQDYAEMIDAPIKTGVEVESVTKLWNRQGYEVRTKGGETYEARFVIAATGPFQIPAVPNVVPEDAAVTQLHSSAYKNPEQLPEGGVLVVGAGSSGVQIAEELNSAGRKVYLSVGQHDRPPRRYRDRDNVWWLGVLGKWEMATPGPGKEHTTIAVTGFRNGYTIDFRELADRGVTLTGRTQGFVDGTITFNDDLVANVRSGDENYLSVLDEADAYIEANGLDLPEEPEARTFLPDPDCMVNPLSELDLAEAGITTIIWATGFRVDYSWLNVPGVVDHLGRPLHARGVTPVAGIYYLGVPWLSRRGSSFIWGTWHDAKYIADQIDIQRNYSEYSGNAGRPTPLEASK
ncbi:MAG: flavin-containing monooxygenase [Galactobacter sp.]